MTTNICSRKGDDEKILGNKDVSRKENFFFPFLKQKQFFHWRNNKKTIIERNHKIYFPEVVTHYFLDKLSY